MSDENIENLHFDLHILPTILNLTMHVAKRMVLYKNGSKLLMCSIEYVRTIFPSFGTYIVFAETILF